MSATRHSRRTAAGFTILELLIAVSLLSVLAVLSWRGMQSVIDGRDAIVERSNELRALTIAMTQIEEDLRRAWPVRLLGLPAPPVGFSAGDDRTPPALELLRETAGGDSSQIQQVVWRLRDGTLERGFSAWSVPSPGEAGNAGARPFTWQPVIDRVEALAFRAWLPGRGWLPAATLALEQRAELARAVVAAPRDGTTGSGAAAGDAGPMTGFPGAPAPGATPLAPGLPGARPVPLVTGVEMLLVRRGERLVRIFAVAD